MGLRNLKKWGFGGLLVLLGLEILTLAPKKVGVSREKKEEVTSHLPHVNSAETTLQDMRGVHLVESSEGQREWELQASQAQQSRAEGSIWQLTGVFVKFYGKTSGAVYTVTGDKGTINTETKDMIIRGHVHGHTSDGFAFRSDSLNYKAKSRQVTTEDPVNVEGHLPKNQLFHISGVGFAGDFEANRLQINHRVVAVKAVPNDRFMTIHSEWATVDSKTAIAHFEKDVRVDLDNIRLTGQKADFSYSTQEKNLKSMLIQGDVKVTDHEHFASSERAIILFAKNEFILQGAPRVLREGNEMRGDEIRFLNGGKEIRVFKAQARVDDKQGHTSTPGGL